ncbi:MAG: inorganic phosphate transporter [Bacteroidaceae bacterium]|nr:inorganic phosphate transporter [Bacteroidaceae bacterium]
MEPIYIIIVFFLLALAIFDLNVGTANNMNFLSSAVGAKAASYRTIMLIASLGIIVGTATSSGMMDISRHGILQPQYFYMNEVMCVFLGVVCTDVMLINLLNTLGLPTSTTVSMIFELFGGSTALAIFKIAHDASDTLSYGMLINTDKVLSIIMAIFLSVAIAFIVGTVVMWITRVIFTFDKNRHSRTAVDIFGAVSITSITYFLLAKGFGQASFMSAAAKEWISLYSGHLMLGLLLGSLVVIHVLQILKINVFKLIVLFGSFSLCMAFAGNDLVNFIGVALAGLSSFQDYAAHGDHNATTYLMTSLTESSNTPLYILILSGVIMSVSLFFSKQVRRVMETSISLSSQKEEDEIFSSSRLSRRLVRATMNTTNTLLAVVPRSVKDWTNSRFERPVVTNAEEEVAFDLVRGSVNLVLSGMLIIMGTSMQLPLSTTYVAFMIGMGSSLADRAWGRESAVYRITGVISVVGGWFLTAGAAFMLCFIITSILYFGGFIAVVSVIFFVVLILFRSHRHTKQRDSQEKGDGIFEEMVRTEDKMRILELLKEHVRIAVVSMLDNSKQIFMQVTEGLIRENIKELRQSVLNIDDQKTLWKKYRGKQIVGMKKIDYYDAVKKNTWFHMQSNSISQIGYCLKRMCDPIVEHVDNNFSPLPQKYIDEFVPLRDEVVEMFETSVEVFTNKDYSKVEMLLSEGDRLKERITEIRHKDENNYRDADSNVRIDLLYLNTLQETQELVSDLRHLLRGATHFQEE